MRRRKLLAVLDCLAVANETGVASPVENVQVLRDLIGELQPTVNVDTVNHKGFPLTQCLSQVAKNAHKVPGWDGTLFKQARDFECTVEDLMEVISTVPRLHEAFMKINPEYKAWVETP